MRSTWFQCQWPARPSITPFRSQWRSPTPDETHLTHQGVQKIREELRFRRSPIRVVPGAPAPPLTNSIGCVGGKCTGVAFLSHFPIRALPSNFNEGQWNTGRIQVAAAHVGNAWLRMGVAYGFSANNKNVATMQRTDDLLSELTERIVFQAHGPRAIMGDFNCHSNLPQFDIWREHGFIEIQDLAMLRWQQEVRPTYRNTTTIDKVWISADLAARVTQVTVDPTYFADHACVYAAISGLPQFEPFNVWRQPMAIQWEQVGQIPDAMIGDLPSAEDPEFLPCLFQRLEHAVDAKCRERNAQGLMPQQKGRCQTLQTKAKHQQTTPLRRSRPRDVQVTYMGETFYHAYWCRQLRRLQSYARLSNSAKSPLLLGPELRNLWIAIRKAPGFAKGFPTAWFHRSQVLEGTPLHLPKKEPAGPVAQLIFQNFQHEFLKLETLLIRARGHAAKMARRADAARAFRDVAKPKALPVQTLATKNIATVTEVDFSAKTVSYEPSALDVHDLVVGPLGPLAVTSHHQGQLQFSEDPPLAVGDTLTQACLKGSTLQVAQEFIDLWNPMWNRHIDQSPTDWDDVALDLGKTLPKPPHEMPLPPITSDQWLRAVRAKKSRSATGPDGVSRQDLLNMPKQFTDRLVDYLNLVDSGQAAWHSCSLTGLIALVEKRPGASQANEFRPICVLSFIYRTWASIRGRQCLSWLDKLACPTQCGNRPGTSARHIWWQIAQIIEGHHQQGTSLSGTITDSVVKCFNTLPRQLVAFCGRALGLPAQLIHSWHHAIHGIARRFVIAGSASAAVMSTTGYPEGDSMSVVAMGILNVAMHARLAARVPQAVTYSYVDNWEALATDPDDVRVVQQALTEFAHQTDIRLDVAKADSWSLTTEGRQTLRQQGMKVVLSGRDLGGQLIYSKKPSIAVIRGRLQQNASFWDWLRRSHAPTSTKLRLLHTVAWPRCLYGISSQSLGEHHFQHMRIAAMQALNWQKKGANSRLQFGLDRDMRGDPAFFCLVTTVNDFRDLHDATIAYPILDSIALRPDAPHAPGPCKTLLERLRAIHWHWLGNGFVQDHEGLEWHLFDSAVQWIHTRLRHGWAKHVGGVVSERATFGGLQCVDIQLAHENLHKLTPAEQGFLRCVQNGTFFTRDLLFRTGKVPNTACPFCSSVDSLNHRLWECSHFAGIRNSVDQEALQWVRQEPTCTVLRGWIVEHPCQVAFRRSLFDIPDEMYQILWPAAVPTGSLHFFTDGSCSHPTTAGLRLGSWACCLADLDDGTFHPIASGGIPSGHQTVLRAEICGAIAAVFAGLQKGRPFTLWVDNQTVFQKLSGFIKEGVTFMRPKQANHDLWNRLAGLCDIAIRAKFFQHIHKVRSHEDPGFYPELVERWVIAGNASADAAAESARDGLPAHVLQFWKASCRRVDRARRMRDAMRKLITQSGLLATADKASLNDQTNQEWIRQIEQPRQYAQADISLTPLPPLEDLPAKHSLGPYAETIYQWVKTLSEGTSVRPHWLTSHQLYIHFQGTTGLKGFRFNQKTNRWNAVDQADPAGFDFHKGANAFQAAVKCLITGLGGTWKPVQRLPEGRAYKCWINCVLVQFSSEMFQRIEDLMTSRGARGITKVAQVMRTWDDFCGSLSP